MQFLFYAKTAPSDANAVLPDTELMEAPLEPVRQIIEISGNSEGDDYVITDPHGDYNVLRLAVEKLGEHGRLLIGGDVIDRCPFSLENIRYLVEQNRDRPIGKEKIFTIRGNHENDALKTIHFIEIIEAIREMHHRPEQWDQFKNAQSNPWLKSLLNSEIALATISQKSEKVFAFALAHSWENSDSFKEKARKFKENFLNEFYFCPPLKSFFYDPCLHIYNGGGWLFKLNKHERDEVKAFVESLPYMIRVGAVDNPSRKVPAFDIVHAAPLNENSINAVASGRSLTKSEITCMTEARFAGYNPEKAGGIWRQERGENSTLTIVGHSPFGMLNYLSCYTKIKVINLDIATYSTGGMLLVNYTKGTVEYIGQSLSEDDDDFQAIHKIMKIIRRELRNNLNPSLVEENASHARCVPCRWF